ncbi:MAG: hypothetical protein AABZ44_08555, partial [Elusimicrobiota bacterium]
MRKILALVVYIANLNFLFAATLLVPKDQPTLQSAIDAASPGDDIRLAPGRHCGAFLNKRLTITGEGQAGTASLKLYHHYSWPVLQEDGAVIVACPDGPKHPAGVSVGLWLSSPQASGSVLSNLSFDGAGISNENPNPLALAIYARDLSNGNNKINDIEISHVHIVGTVQGITNNGGDGWHIHHNTIKDLSVFDCVMGNKLCFGGVGVVLQLWRGAVPQGQARSYPVNNSVAHNNIIGAVPDTLSAFSMAGILALN